MRLYHNSSMSKDTFYAERVNGLVYIFCGTHRKELKISLEKMLLGKTMIEESKYNCKFCNAACESKYFSPEMCSDCSIDYAICCICEDGADKRIKNEGIIDPAWFRHFGKDAQVAESPCEGDDGDEGDMPPLAEEKLELRRQ